MSASPKQVQLIDKLQNLGATIPCKGDMDGPDFSMLESVENADKYIKQWIHLLRASNIKHGVYREGSNISVAQESLINRLFSKGAERVFDEEGDEVFPMFQSVSAADQFIKQWEHLLWEDLPQCSAADWGGIPNH